MGTRASPWFPVRDSASMRFIHLYLIVYFVLLVGAGLALWQSGVLGRLPGLWLFLSLIVTVGLGIVLAVSSARPTATTKE